MKGERLSEDEHAIHARCGGTSPSPAPSAEDEVDWSWLNNWTPTCSMFGLSGTWGNCYFNWSGWGRRRADREEIERLVQEVNELGRAMIERKSRSERYAETAENKKARYGGYGYDGSDGGYGGYGGLGLGYGYGR